MTKKRPSLLLAVITAGSAVGWAETAPAASHVAAAAARCEALASADFSGVVDAPTRVSSAKLVEASPSTSAYCRVEGNVTPQIEFEVRLPLSNWNGKFFAIAAGSTPKTECDVYLKRGYSCMPMFRADKRGRRDDEWVELLSHNLPAQVNATRSTHLLTLAAKAVIDRYYSKAASRAYFTGCSAGGNRAMAEVQQFPWDYDGVIAGAPSFDLAEYVMRAAWTVRQFLDKNELPILNGSDIQLLHRAVLSECDADDGLKDGIVGNPMGCKFDPSKLLCKASKEPGCLTLQQVEAVKRIYAGPMTSAGQQISVPGVLPGSELGWNDALGQELLQFIDQFFQFAFYGATPTLKSMTFDFDRDYKRLGLGAVYVPPVNSDLRRFKSAGGKLIVYQGSNDTTQVAGDTVDYYKTTERTMGGRASTQDFFRLFMVPGMDHCTGGAGAYAIDYSSYLEAWVEQGKAPNVMIGAHVKDAYIANFPSAVPGAAQLSQTTRSIVTAWSLALPLDPAVPVSFTRPIYPYPLYAKYKGSGDPNVATSFRPIDQSSGSLE